MAKQQTLTIVVDDDSADPAETVERALERYLECGPIWPQYGDDPEEELRERGPNGYLIIEEN